MSSISKLSVNTKLPEIKEKEAPPTIILRKSLPLNGAIWKGMREDKENISPPLNNRISQKKVPEVFTFDKVDFANSIRHGNIRLKAKDVKEREHLSLKTLSELLKRPVTSDGWVNFRLDRPLDTPIDENDPNISILYLVNLKKLKNNPQLDIPLDNPISRQELEAHLQIPVMQAILRECLKTQLTYAILQPYLPKTNSDVSTWQKHLNYFLHRSPNHKISLAELKTFLGYSPSADETINFVKNRDLRTEITKEERYHHDWKTHINHLLRLNNPARSLDQFVSFDEFRKFFKNGNLMHHFNCNRRKPFDHPFTVQEAINWKLGRSLDHPVSMTEKVNLSLNKDLSLGRGVGPKEHYQLVFGKEAVDTEECLKEYLGRAPVEQEEINWILGRDLTHPVTTVDKENCF